MEEVKIVFNGKVIPEITSPFGAIREFSSKPHTGIDLDFELGDHLMSPIEGVVSKVVDYGDKATGKTIFIEFEDKTLVLGHMNKILVEEGEGVSIGKILGEIGNTGHVVSGPGGDGSHLHLAVKDSNGEFINPENITNQLQNIYGDLNIINNANESPSVIESIQNIGQFFYDLKNEGWWYAFTGKRPKEWWLDLFHSLNDSIFAANDVYLLMPAVILTFAYMFIGKNRTTKYILPLYFAYFVTEVYAKILGG